MEADPEGGQLPQAARLLLLLKEAARSPGLAAPAQTCHQMPAARWSGAWRPAQVSGPERSQWKKWKLLYYIGVIYGSRDRKWKLLFKVECRLELDLMSWGLYWPSAGMEVGRSEGEAARSMVARQVSSPELRTPIL